VQVTRSEDPVFYNHPLPFEREYAPLGFRLSVATNSETVLAALDESWRPFHTRFSNKPMEIRIAVGDDALSEEPPEPVVRAQGNLISFIGDANHFSIGDLATGFGYCWISAKATQRQTFLRYHYLDSLVLTLIDNLFVSTIHAACVTLDGHGVLLCGQSEAGKSSLAYACARAGWEYLCDDASFLLRDKPTPTVIGNPFRLRLRPDAGRLFPEFQQRIATERPNGKMSIEIATSRELGIKLVCECRPRYVIFLEREAGAEASIRVYPAEEALDRLASTIAIGSPEQRRARVDHFRSLLELPVYRLRYGSLDGAVDCLSSLVRSRN
jgi:hypothetical protein